MKNFFTAVVVLLCSYGFAAAQTEATDFTATDCSGVSHNFFSELNSGKVIVLTWVMPCGTCINDARGAFEAVKSFSASHPGRVLYYMIDDFGNNSCSTLSGWANTNAIKPNITIFQNDGVVIDENNYGGTGMPHVTVVGPDRKIYFNVRNGSNSQQAIKNAISSALSQTSVDESENFSSIKVTPNPVSDQLTISFGSNLDLSARVEIFNMLGENILNENFTETDKMVIKTGMLGEGIYVAKIYSGGSVIIRNFVVSR